MRKKFSALIILLLVTALVLCACFSQPFKEITLENNKSGNTEENPSVTERSLYISGAVQRDGYIIIPQLCDYKTVLEIAGVTDFSVITANLNAPVSVSSDILIIDFICDGKVYSSVNVNGGFVLLRQSIDGVEDIVIDKLADFIEANGKITNRDVLKLALGDDYENNYYKFYIDVNDYA